MAVTPVGNPYVESSDRVSDYPGASEALAERIDIVGVNPFANAAARNAAIPSPVEGQMASLSDTDTVLRYNGSSWVAVGVPTILGATVATEQTTTSTSYTDLSTAGPAVTITTGTKALVTITGYFYSGAGDYPFSFIGFVVSGASTVAVSDTHSLTNRSLSSTPIIQASAVYLLTGLTAGSNVFTLKYRVTSGTGNFKNRSIIVQDLGS